MIRDLLGCVSFYLWIESETGLSFVICPKQNLSDKIHVTFHSSWAVLGYVRLNQIMGIYCLNIYSSILYAWLFVSSCMIINVGLRERIVMVARSPLSPKIMAALPDE